MKYVCCCFVVRYHLDEINRMTRFKDDNSDMIAFNNASEFAKEKAFEGYIVDIAIEYNSIFKEKILELHRLCSEIRIKEGEL